MDDKLGRAVINDGAVLVYGEGATANEVPSEEDLKNIGNLAGYFQSNGIF